MSDHVRAIEEDHIILDGEGNLAPIAQCSCGTKYTFSTRDPEHRAHLWAVHESLVRESIARALDVEMMNWHPNATMERACFRHAAQIARGEL